MLTCLVAGIQRLHIDENCPLPPSHSTPLVFPRLVELSLSDIVNQPKAIEFLQHADMPHLRSLGIYGWATDPSLSPQLIAAINRVAPQLETFVFIPPASSETEPFELKWTNFTNLRKLALPASDTTVRILKLILVPLQALRIVDATENLEGWQQNLEDTLAEWAPCMKRLSRLVLPAAAEDDDHFAQLCHAKGVQEEYAEPQASFYNDWEYSVLWWQVLIALSATSSALTPSRPQSLRWRPLQ